MNRIIQCSLAACWTAVALFAAPAPESTDHAPVSAVAPEDRVNDVRNIRFQFDGIPYADVLQRFAQMAEKPLIADTKIEGTLTFSDPTPFTYGEALDTLNLILSMKGVTLVESDRYLRLVAFKELSQMPLKIFRGLDQTGDARPGEIVTVVLELKYLDAAETAQATSSMLSSAGAMAPLNRGRGLIVTDRLANIRRIRELLLQIDSESTVERQMKTYTLIHASGAVVADLINKTFGSATAPKRTVFNQQTKRFDELTPDPNDYITAVFDELSRTLILFGPRDRIVLAEELIQRFEGDQSARAGEVKIFYPRSTRADDLAQMIRQAIPGVASDRDHSSSAATKARVIVDPPMNRLIVTAPIAGQLDAIENLVRRIDQSTDGENPGAVAQSVQVTRVFRIRTADLTSLFKIVTEALSHRAPNGRVISGANAVIDTGTRSLVVTGSPGQVQQAADIISQIDAELSQDERRTTKFIELGSGAEVQRLASLVEQLYKDQLAQGARQAGAFAKILPDIDAGRLIVTGSDDDFSRIERIVVQLKEPKIETPVRELTIVTLQHVKLTDSLKTITALVDARMAEPPFKQMVKPFVMPDTPNNRLYVTASDEQLREIQRIIAAVDVVPDLSRGAETRVIRLKQALATDLAGLVEKSLNSQREQVKVLVDSRSNSLVVTGDPAAVDTAAQMVEALDAEPNTSRSEMRMIELHHADASAVAPLLNDLFGQLMREKRGPSFRSGSRVLPDQNGNRLIVTGPADELEQMATLVAQLDTAPTQGGGARLFKLKNADALEVAGVLTNAISSVDYRRQRTSRVNVAADEKTNTLIVSGSRSDIQDVALIIEQLDKEAPQRGRVFQIIEVKSGNVAQLANLAMQVFAGQNKGRPVNDSINITPDGSGKRLILLAPTGLIDQVITIVAALDQHPEQPPRNLHLVEIKNGSVQQLLPLVTRIYGEQTQGSAEKPATLFPDMSGSRIAVLGSREQARVVEEIVRTLDREKETAERETRVYDLDAASAPELARTVQTIYQEELKARSDGPRTQTLILPDPMANRLVVSGETAELTLIDGIVKRLDKVSAQTMGTRVFKLANSEASQVSSILSTALVRVTPYGRTVPRVSVGVDAKNNLLIVSGEPKDLQSVASIVDQVDGAISREPRLMRIIPLKNGVASDVATKVRQLYLDQLKGSSGTGVADALILGDDASNRLIIAGGEKQLESIETIVQQFDSTSTGSSARQLRIVPLKNNSASALSAIVSQLFYTHVRHQDPAQRLIVTAAPEDRNLVLEAPTPLLERIESFVQALDGEPKQTAVEVRTYHLQDAAASELAPTLARLFSEQRRGRRDTIQPRFEADGSANVLMVAATPEQFTQIDELIKQLQTSVEIASEIRTFPLQHADASQLVGVLQTMLRDDSMGGWSRRYRSYRPGGDSAQIRIAAASALNAVVVQGPPQKIAAAEQLIRTLDRPQSDEQMQIQTLHLKNAQADQVAIAVGRTMSARGLSRGPQQVIVTPVSASNSLLINGPAPLVEEVIKIVRELDQETTSEELGVHIYNLEHGEAREVAPIVTQLLQNVSRVEARSGRSGYVPATVAVDQRSNGLVISGTPAHFKLVESLLPTLDRAPERSERDVQFFWLQNATAFDVASQLESMFESRKDPAKPVIDPDPIANSLTVIARKADLAEIAQIVGRLDAAAEDNSIQIRMIPLDQIPAEQMARMVENLFSQMHPGRIRIADKLPPPADKPKPRTQSDSQSPAPGGAPPTGTSSGTPPADTPASAEGTASDSLPEVVIAIDKAANALLVSGRSRDIDEITALVFDLSISFVSGEAQFRQFTLKEADPIAVAKALTELFREPPPPQQQRQGERQGEQQKPPQPAPPKIAVVAEPRTRSLIVRAKPTDFALLEVLIQQLDAENVSSQLAYRSVRLENAQPAKVLPLVEKMVAQLGAVRPGEPVAVAPDPRNRAIFVVSRDSVLNQIEQVIRSLDTPADFAEAELMVVNLKKADATQLASVLQGLLNPGRDGQLTAEARELQEQVRRLNIRDANGELAGLDLTQPIKIMADPVQGGSSGSRLVILSTLANMPALSALVDTMDRIPLAETKSVRIYPLKFADAPSVQRIIEDLYTTGSRSGRGRRDDRPTITIDERTNALVVSGDEDAFAQVENLLSQLDKELPEEMRDVQIVPLENADASTVAASLQRLLDAREQQAARSRQGVRPAKTLVIADSRSNSLLVGGSNEGFELVKSLARELDQAAPAISSQIRLVPLQEADARNLSATLSTLFNQRYLGIRGGEASRRNRPIIMADPRSNSLLVAASVEDNHVLDELLAKLDRKIENPALLFTVIGLQQNDASRVAQMLQRLFAARLQSLTPPGQSPSSQDQVQIEPDLLSNALVISASKENLELIQELLKKVDVEPAATGGLVQLFTLKTIDAQRASSMLRSLIDQGLYRPGKATSGRGGGALREALAITVDSRSNTLIVSASPENLAVIKELIEKIDSADYAGGDNIRIYSLKFAKASRLAQVLDQFFRSRRMGEAIGGSSRGQTPVTVTADDRTGTLLVTGSPETFAVIDRMVQQLDSADVAAKTQFKVFPLKQTTAAKLQSTLQRLFANRPATVPGQPAEPITVVADTWANALIVGASMEDLPMVESLIGNLDSDQGETGAKIQVLPLIKADARRVAQTVQALYRDGSGMGGAAPVTVNVDERLNAIVVSAGESDFNRIAELVKKLDTELVARISEIRIFPLRNARAVEMAVILNAALNSKPPPLVEQSPNRQSLLQFITRVNGGQEVVTSVLKEAVLVTSDPRSNSLIISGPVDYMYFLELLIQQLDSTSPQKAQIKVFPLKNADARQMSELLIDLFRLQQISVSTPQRAIQYTLLRPELLPDPNRIGLTNAVDAAAAPLEAADAGVAVVEPAATFGTIEQNSLTVTVDRRTNSLLIGGSEEHVALATRIIDELDSSPAQERRTEVYRLRNAQAPQVQIALRTFLDQDRQRVVQLLGQEAVGTTQRLLDQEVAIVAEPVSNSLLLSASPRYFDQFKALIEELDQPLPQVLIQVLLAEVTLDGGLDLGVEWTYHGTQGDHQYAIGTDFGVANELKNLGGFSSAVTGNDYSFILRALQSDGRLEVLSRPQILTADNQQATIDIGQRVPLITNSRVTERGDTINQFTYENVGVQLNVTPRISPDGFVKMDVGPTISAISSSNVDISPGVRVPIINQRKATTTVSVQSGQSILIGGLISTTDDVRTKKVPYLGDIPYVGALFRSKRRIEDRKELLIILTPQVLVQSPSKPSIAEAADITRQQLDRSTLRDKTVRDPLQMQMLEKLYPSMNSTNAPVGE